MKKVIYLVMLMVLLVSSMFILAACGNGGNGTTSTPTSSPTVSPTSTALPEGMVEIVASGFNPQTITIKAGESVTWYNKSDRRYWVKAESGDWETGYIPIGARFSVTFDEPGEYPYYDLVHKEVTGLVIVE